MKISIFLTLLAAAISLQGSTAFLDFIPPPSAMPMESLIAPESILGSGFATDAPMELVNTMALHVNQAAAAASTPEGESELLNDAAHVALDFSGIFRPSKSTMRLLSIVGRLLGLLADYLPDHTIHTEEVLIQLFFIFMTGQELLEDERNFFS